MGYEAQCTATWKRQRSGGKALLETESVVFRGEFRVELPFAAILRVGAVRGRLTLASSDGTLVLSLGDQAVRWAAKIRNPPTLADKLGVTGAARVALVGVHDPLVVEPVRMRAKTVSLEPEPASDIVIVGVNRASDLQQFEQLRRAIAPSAAISEHPAEGSGGSVGVHRARGGSGGRPRGREGGTGIGYPHGREVRRPAGPSSRLRRGLTQLGLTQVGLTPVSGRHSSIAVAV